MTDATTTPPHMTKEDFEQYSHTARKFLNDDEKLHLNEEFRRRAGDKTAVSEFIKSITTRYGNLMRLTRKHAKLSKGQSLSCPVEGQEPVVVSQKQLNHWQKLTDDLVGQARYYISAARSGPRRKVEAKDMKGVYIPVVLGPELQDFVTSADFGYVDPTDPKSGKLIDSLPLLSQGFAIKTTVSTILYSYMDLHELQDTENGQKVYPDKAFKDAFGGDQPALYDDNGTLQWTTNDKGELASFEGAKNTYEILSARPVKKTNRGQEFKFDSESCFIIHFPSLISCNIFSTSDLDKFPSYKEQLADTETREGLLREYELVKKNREAVKAMFAGAKEARKKARGKARKEASRA